MGRSRTRVTEASVRREQSDRDQTVNVVILNEAAGPLGPTTLLT
jgi:hypothetical protein